VPTPIPAKQHTSTAAVIGLLLQTVQTGALIAIAVFLALSFKELRLIAGDDFYMAIKGSVDVTGDVDSTVQLYQGGTSPFQVASRQWYVEQTDFFSDYADFYRN